MTHAQRLAALTCRQNVRELNVLSFDRGCERWNCSIGKKKAIFLSLSPTDCRSARKRVKLSFPPVNTAVFAVSAASPFGAARCVFGVIHFAKVDLEVVFRCNQYFSFWYAGSAFMRKQENTFYAAFLSHGVKRGREATQIHNTRAREMLLLCLLLASCTLSEAQLNARGVLWAAVVQNQQWVVLCFLLL